MQWPISAQSICLYHWHLVFQRQLHFRKPGTAKSFVFRLRHKISFKHFFVCYQMLCWYQTDWKCITFRSSYCTDSFCAKCIFSPFLINISSWLLDILYYCCSLWLFFLFDEKWSTYNNLLKSKFTVICIPIIIGFRFLHNSFQ